MIRLTHRLASTEECITRVHAATAQDVNNAVRAAKAALMRPSWKLLPGTERGRLMNKLADLIESKKELLASIEAWDNGKNYFKDISSHKKNPKYSLKSWKENVTDKFTLR